MNVKKININQSEPTYDIASDAYDITYEDSNVGDKVSDLYQKLDRVGSNIVDEGTYTDLDIADENGNVISRFVGGEIQTKNFNSSNTPAQTDNSDDADFQIADENGNVIMRLKDGHIKTKEFDSSDFNFNSSNQNDIKQEDIFNSFVIPTIPSQNGTDKENQLINLNTATASEIYSLYDNLINRSNGYITKEILGKDSSGQYDIWRLTLSPKFKLTAGNSNIKTGIYSRTSRKVIIEPNVHGRPYDPIDATFTVFWLCKFLVDDYKTNDVARYLRNNYTFIIIPQPNPWSMDNNSYGNYNGVNINRNYDYNFEPNKSFDYGTNSGPYAFSEKETQYIRDTVLSNTDAYAWMDLHSWGDANKTKAFYSIKDAPHTFTIDRAFKVFQNTQSIIEGVDVRFFKDFDSAGWGPAWGEKVVRIWHIQLECGCRVSSGDTSAFTSAALTSNFYNLIGFLCLTNNIVYIKMGKSLIIKNADFSGVSINLSENNISSMFTWEDTYAIVGDGNSLGKKITVSNDPYYQTFCASNYVDISKFTALRLTAMCRESSTATVGLAFYSSTDESSVISGVAYNNDENTYKTKTITIPSGAVYIRTTFYIENKEKFRCIGIAK